MASRNDVTGDKIQTKGILSKEGEENFDRIFRKKTEDPIKKPFPHNILKESVSRIEQIGQNGNDGIHYEYELDKSTGEVVKIDSKRLTDAHNGL